MSWKKFICACYDVQGFYVNDRFHPREAAIVGDGFLISMEMAKLCNCEVGELKEKWIRASGLPIENSSRAISPDGAANLMKSIYNFYKDGSKSLVAVTTQEAQNILDFYEIPSINVMQLYGSSMPSIDNKRSPCYLHELGHPAIMCALNIAQDLKIYIDDMVAKEN
jgi:hypothetical protein